MERLRWMAGTGGALSGQPVLVHCPTLKQRGQSIDWAGRFCDEWRLRIRHRFLRGCLANVTTLAIDHCRLGMLIG